MVKDICDVYCFDNEKVDSLKDRINDLLMTSTSKIFIVLANETRLKIAYSLTLEEEKAYG